MKLIVFSDSHGKTDTLRRIMRTHADAHAFLHFGDGAPSFLALCRELTLAGFAVKGNCDFFTGDYPLEKSMTLTFDGVKLFLTHGDSYGVNFSTTRLALAAKEQGCKIALYGHTHVGEETYLPPLDETDTPLYIMNPGSTDKPRDSRASYGIIEIQNGQILMNIAKI